MRELITIGLSVFSGIVASTGFWQWVMSRRTNNDATTRLIMGLACIKGQELGFEYIKQGYVTPEELNDLQKYIYVPYVELGGNGVLERLMSEVVKLPIRHAEPFREGTRHE